MSDERRGLAFESAMLPALSRAGLSGERVHARLEGDVMTLAGSRGGSLAVPARQEDRLRLVRFSGARVRTLYEAKIWRSGASEPLLLIPIDAAPYGRAMRAFAARVAELRGVRAVMRGPGLATATINLLLVGGSITALAAGAAALAWLAGGWGWWLFAAAIAVVDLMVVRDTFAKRWPRRIRSLDELDRELPPKEERA